MSRLSQFFRPTLKRRVIVALFIAWALIWVVLATYSAYEEVDVNISGQRMRGFAQSLLASVDTTTDPNVARAIVASAHRLINWGKQYNDIPVETELKLSDLDGQPVFVSTGGGDANLFSGDVALTSRTLHGATYLVAHVASPRWGLSIAQPQQSLRDAIAANLHHGNLSIYLLIAFPFVLVPIWLAVARGLGPLQQLSNRIANKSPDDLTPLGFNTHYAELLPLSTAIDHLVNRLRVKVDREHAFVQDAAHELRTPLALISAEAHVLTMSADPQQRQAAQQRLNLAITRASHLVQQLLVLAHIENNNPTIVTIDVAAMVRQEIALLAPTAMRRDIELSLEGPDVLQFELDNHILQSILQNLLTNAIAYIQVGGRIVVTLQQSGARLQISVADDGPGIPESQRNQVFERFVRGADHDTPGSGLGLSIVSQGAAQLGGKLTLGVGLDGKGCEFILELVGGNSAAYYTAWS